MRVAVIGAGSWGTALGIVASRAGHDVRLWSRNALVVNSINNEHTNSEYLTGVLIPGNADATTKLDDAITGAELIILAAPSHATRGIVQNMAPFIKGSPIIVSATKGIDIETGQRISEIVQDVLGNTRFVCLSGPSFAKEVVEGHPTAIVAAGLDDDANRLVQAQLSFENLRIYTNNDVVGTELSGSVKNVMAIAAGMVAGLGFGTNSIAALITRGLAEMTRLALRQGAQTETLMGLAGLGDLVLTCTGSLSRNRFVGEELGKGRGVDEIISGMHEVAEGVKTTLAVKYLAAKTGVEMPITDQVYAVLYEKKLVTDAVNELMSRPLRAETV